MPRPKNVVLLDFFDKNDDDQVICNNDLCRGKILSSHSANLERHLAKIHRDLHDSYMAIKNAKRSKNELIQRISAVGAGDIIDLQSTIVIGAESPFTGRVYTNALSTRGNIELAIVEFFIKSARHFKMLNDRSFQMLVQPAFSALGLGIDELGVNEKIKEHCEKMRADIREDFKDKLVALKIDVVTKQNLTLLGIHVQRFKNGYFEIKTLGVKELKASESPEYLKCTILRVLQNYSLNDILTITIDNANNMLISSVDTNDEEELGQTLELDQTAIEEKLEAIRAHFLTYDINCVRCGANTLQQCISDVLRRADIAKRLEQCKAVVKALRSQEAYADILEDEQYKKPPADSTTSWSSTLNMLERLYEMKGPISLLSAVNSDLYLSPDDWKFIGEFIETFKPIYNAALRLQTEQLCFSELYVIIMDIIFKIESLPSSNMRTHLLEGLLDKKSELLDMDIFNAAVYLDPRIKIVMSSDQKERAKNYIKSLYDRIKYLKDNFTPIADNLLEKPNTSSVPFAVKKSTSITLQEFFKEELLWETNEQSPSAQSIKQEPPNSSVDSFSAFLQKLDRNSPDHVAASSCSLLTDLLLYERQARLPLTTNIFDYWSSKNNTLTDVAFAILATPCTQASVKRLTPSLKYMLEDQNNEFTVADVEHILMVKANAVFKYES
ncbi:uncharacterized protein LOC106088181 [Stomoxys calcitrans]|uniref:HAT C-terminal dimerisation domain-containing protein n=1 Tax=Stomoxys calcitrans TaxID=35570 RepID=A0A1I8P2L2_STOCA|nr:uncharacterized protein LOC106088181 [Stomoxys calcitrans]